MARPPRHFTVVPFASVHKVWRGHNKENNLGSDHFKSVYLEMMNQDIESTRFQDSHEIHAITLMSNHGHEILYIKDPALFSRHMRRHHSRYGMYFNRQNNRCGKVAQDRPWTTLIESDHHEMIAIFYAHANPIRAGIVKDGRNYYWSTHLLYAFGKRELWMRNVVLPKWYLSLGNTPEQRQRRYRQLFELYLKDSGLKKQQFLRKRFYGNTLWMQNKERDIKEWRRAHDPP